LRKGATKDTWWLEFVFQGVRHRVRIGSGISRTVAREIAAVKRGPVLKGEAGIGGKKRKDILFEKAVDEFMKWVEANKKPRTVGFYRSCFHRLRESFKGLMLSQIHPFLVEKHKQKRIAAGHRVAVNRELAAVSAMFNRCLDWGKFEGINPVRKVERLDEPLSRLRFLSDEEEQRLLNQCQELLRSIVLLGIYAGLRIKAEALTLKKASVDLGRRRLTIEAA